MVFCAVEEVCHVEDEQGEVVGCVDRGVDVPEKPLVVVHQPLLDGCACSQALSVAVVARAEQVCMGGVDVVALVEFPLQPGQADQHGKIAPDVAVAQLDGIAHTVACAQLRSGDLAAPDAEHARSFQAVEVLCETAAIGAQEVALHEQHDKRVDFIERVQDREEVAGITVGGNSHKVAQRRGQQ